MHNTSPFLMIGLNHNTLNENNKKTSVSRITTGDTLGWNSATVGSGKGQQRPFPLSTFVPSNLFHEWLNILKTFFESKNNSFT